MKESGFKELRFNEKYAEVKVDGKDFHTIEDFAKTVYDDIKNNKKSWRTFYINEKKQIFVSENSSDLNTPSGMISGRLAVVDGKIAGIKDMGTNLNNLGKIAGILDTLNQGDFLTKDGEDTERFNYEHHLESDTKGFRIFSDFDEGEGLTLEEFSEKVAEIKEMQINIAQAEKECTLSYDAKNKKFTYKNGGTPPKEARFAIVKTNQNTPYKFFYGESIVHQNNVINLEFSTNNNNKYHVPMLDSKEKISISGVAKFEPGGKLKQMSFDITTVADLTKINNILQGVKKTPGLDPWDIKINTLDEKGKSQAYGNFTLEDLGILSDHVTSNTHILHEKEKLQGFKNPKKLIADSNRTKEQKIKLLIKQRIDLKERINLKKRINNKDEPNNPKPKPLKYTIKCKDGKLEKIEFVLGKNKETDGEIIATALQSLKLGKSVDLSTCEIHLKTPGFFKTTTMQYPNVDSFLARAAESKDQKKDPQITPNIQKEVEGILGKNSYTSENKAIVVEEYNEDQEQYSSADHVPKAEEKKTKKTSNAINESFSNESLSSETGLPALEIYNENNQDDGSNNQNPIKSVAEKSVADFIKNNSSQQLGNQPAPPPIKKRGFLQRPGGGGRNQS